MGQMKDEIIALCKRAAICQDIHRGADLMVKNNSTEYFTKAQLVTIAELSATESIKANREARRKLSEWETELAECKKIFDNRKQSLYEQNGKTAEDYEETLKHHQKIMNNIEKEEYDALYKEVNGQENKNM